MHLSIQIYTLSFRLTLAPIPLLLTFSEMHWHITAEVRSSPPSSWIETNICNLQWSYMLAGSARISAVDAEGKSYNADIVSVIP